MTAMRRRTGRTGDGARHAPRRRRAPEPETKAVPGSTPPLRVAFIPGVEPDRFARRWRSGPRPTALTLVPVPLSRQESVLTDGEADMCFVRLPLATGLRETLHVIELWEERPAIVVGCDHVLSILDEIGDTDLADEQEISSDHADDAADRIAVVAAGVGYTRMPLSLARLHHRKDAVHRPHRDGEPTRIALVWPRDRDDALRQEFVGVVRGRTIRSSR